jgi:hypothetical protein
MRRSTLLNSLDISLLRYGLEIVAMPSFRVVVRKRDKA